MMCERVEAVRGHSRKCIRFAQHAEHCFNVRSHCPRAPAYRVGEDARTVIQIRRESGLTFKSRASPQGRTSAGTEAVAEAVGPRTTLTLRLSLIITVLLALVTLAGGVFVVRKARNDVREEVRSTLSLTGHFLDAELDLLHDQWSANGHAVPVFQLRELKDIRHLSVRFYDNQGHLLDSNVDAAGHRPEAPGWFMALVRMTSAPASPETRPVVFNGTTVGRLVIAPDPTFEIDEMWTTSGGLLKLLLLFFVLLNGLVWWAVSRALQPIEQILQALDEVRGGDLSTRLPSFGLPEMSRISVGFNHMAEALEDSVGENQRLTRELLQAAENERRNLAHDLHDEIGQCVSAIHADAAAIRNRGSESVRESAEAIVEVTGHIKEIVRSMLRRLRPAYLEGLGLEAALREQIAGFCQRNPKIVCALSFAHELSDLQGEVGIAVYRVIQESLTNIAVHANARSATVEVMQLDAPVAAGRQTDATPPAGLVQVVVADDGAGFFQKSANRGFGLAGIRERVKALGGTCVVDSEPGRGTKISVQLPLAVALVDQT
jgi:two-component system, NarL family, sensor histidine kinase UhpB